MLRYCLTNRSAILLAALLLCLIGNITYAQVGIGTLTPDANAILHLEHGASPKGFMLPRLTTAQRTALGGAMGAAQIGMMVVDSSGTNKGLWLWTGSSWVPFAFQGDGPWNSASNYVYLNSNTDSVGVGLSNPTEKLEVAGNVKAYNMGTYAWGTPSTIKATVVSNVVTDFGTLRLERGRDTGTPGPVATNDVLGRVAFAGHNGANYQLGAFIDGVATQNWTGAAQGAGLTFYTTPNGTLTSIAQMNIDASGWVTMKNASISPNAPDALTILPYGAGLGQTGALALRELTGNGSNYVGFKAPDNLGATMVWTLPGADGINGQVLTTNGTGLLSWANPGSTSPWTRTTNYTYPVTLTDSIGIGTATPLQALDVAGNIRANGLVVGSDSVFYTTGGNWVIHIGPNAGKDNTIGTQSVYIGPSAGMMDNAGAFNTMIGNQAGMSINGGNANTIIGHKAMLGTSTGASNTVVGAEAGNFITGSYNTLLGYYSSAADNLTNATAIGYNAHVATSNSLVLGYNNVGTYTNIGIGTDSPDTTLHVVGKMRYQDGTEAAGYVLTSDASGNATWGAPASTGPWTSATNYIYPVALGDSVGLGTNTPSERLDISGHLRLQGEAISPTGTGTSGSIWLGDATTRYNSIFQTATSHNLAFWTNNGSWNEIMTIVNANGRVGIGTSAPNEKLEVAGNIRARQVWAVEDGAQGFLVGGSYNVQPNDAGELALLHARGTAAAPNPLQNGDRLGNISFNGYDGTDFVDGARIHAVATEPFAPGAHGSLLAFRTVPNGTTGALDRMLIGNDGQVTIGDGANTMSQRLNVDGNIAAFNPTNTASFMAMSNSNIANNNSTITLIRSRGGSMTTPTGIQSNDRIGTMEFVGHNGTSYSMGASIRAEATEIWNAAAQGSRISFLTTANGDASAQERMVIDHNGNIGIGGPADVNYRFRAYGKLRSNGVNETSDRRWKQDIVPVDGALRKVMALQGVYYHWRTAEYPQMNFGTGRQMGLIAQDVEQVVPELVSTDADGYKSVEYSHMVALLLEAMKEQQAQIEELKRENAELRQGSAQLETLEVRMRLLEAQLSRMQPEQAKK